MDPVTLILAALAAGVASGAGETATQALKDGYAGLKALIRQHFAGNPEAEEVLVEHEADPGTYEKPLGKHLTETGAARDEQILAAAANLIETANQAGVKTKYEVTVTGGKVGLIGDHGTVTMN